MTENYSNLNIWKDAVALAVSVYRVTREFPKEENYGLVSQLKRAVVSISSNVAEGSSRKSKKDFSRFVDIAIGSLHEVESLLIVSRELGYVSVDEQRILEEKLARLGKSLNAFRKFLVPRPSSAIRSPSSVA